MFLSLYGGISMVILGCILAYYCYGLIISPINFLLRIYIPPYDWFIDTIQYPFTYVLIMCLSKKKVVEMYDGIDWEYRSRHWAWRKYKQLVEERIFFHE